MRTILVLALLTATAHANPTLTVNVPSTLPAWSTATAKITITNTTSVPIVPLAIELSSDAGTLSAWGLWGSCAGALRTCSIEMKWAFLAPARRRKTWELLLGRTISQAATPPTSLETDATERLVGLEPVAPGETIELTTAMLATYEHGDKLTATMRFAPLDPKTLPLCAPSSQPSSPTFVTCAPVSKLTSATVYTPETELANVQTSLTTTASFTVDHPAFDVGAARKRATVSAGPYGYMPSTRQWIVVDAARARTRVVGKTKAIQDLPGNWLEQLLSLERFNTVTVYWNAIAGDAARVQSTLVKARLVASAATFKGHTDPARFTVTFERAEVAALAKAMRTLGYQMTERGVAKP